jgi:hypothetical protein
MQMDYCGNSPRRFLWDATEAATIVDAAPDRDSNKFFFDNIRDSNIDRSGCGRELIRTVFVSFFPPSNKASKA